MTCLMHTALLKLNVSALMARTAAQNLHTLAFVGSSRGEITLQKPYIAVPAEPSWA